MDNTVPDVGGRDIPGVHRWKDIKRIHGADKTYYPPDRIRVYVAGPISQVDKKDAVSDALKAAQTLVDDGRFAPFVPQLSVVWEEHYPGLNDHDTWLEIDLPWVLVSDCVLRLPGPSRGSDTEVGFAKHFGIPVYTEVEELLSNPPVKGDSRFHALLTKIDRLHSAKQADYGGINDPFANIRASHEWGIPPWVGALVRLNDKVRRLQTFARTHHLSNEGAQDSLLDVAVYSLIASILLEEEESES